MLGRNCDSELHCMLSMLRCVGTRCYQRAPPDHGPTSCDTYRCGGVSW